MSVVKVLVVGSSPVSREYISGLLNSDPEVQIVAFADSADNAKEKIATLSPDVAILRLDLGSISYIRSVLPQLTLPAVVITDTATDNFNALKSGTVEFVKMPIVKTASNMESFTTRLVHQIKVLSKIKVRSVAPTTPVTSAASSTPSASPTKLPFVPEPVKEAPAAAPKPVPKITEKNDFVPKFPDPAPKTKLLEPIPKSKIPEPLPKTKAEPYAADMAKADTSDSMDSTARALAAATAAKQKLGNITPKGKHHVIALGASTGGTDALQTVLQNLPTTTPGIVIVQHMPEMFTKMYADRLDRVCKMRCTEAVDGERVEVGKIILAAGNYHLRLAKDARGYYVTSQHGEKVSGHCPSVDVLFESVANVAGSDAIGAIFTGMGADGAVGLKKMRDAGAYTIGQDQNSCIVYGMPMVAYNIGAVCRQAPLDNIAQIILENC